MMSVWSARSAREKLLLGAAAAVVILAGLIQFLLIPAVQRRADAEVRVGEAASTLLRLERLRTAGVTQAPAAPRANAAASAAALASEAGLVAAIAPEGAPALSFIFPSADPQQVFGWIAQVETSLGLRVRSAELTAAEPGRVSAAITFADAGGP
jgi:type II secretory pathway component PulM